MVTCAAVTTRGILAGRVRYADVGIVAFINVVAENTIAFVSTITVAFVATYCIAAGRIGIAGLTDAFSNVGANTANVLVTRITVTFVSAPGVGTACVRSTDVRII